MAGRVVIVTGGRSYYNVALLFEILDKMLPVGLLVHGGCSTGADALASVWAARRNVPTQVFPADWYTYGKSAGPVRNVEMLEAHPGATVIAFSGGRGTAHCLAYAKSLGMHTYEVGRGRG